MNRIVGIIILVLFVLPLAVIVIGLAVSVSNDAWRRTFNRMSPLAGGLFAGGTLFTGVALVWPVNADEFTDCGTLLRQNNGYADIYFESCKDARNGVLTWTLLAAGVVAVAAASMRSRSIADTSGTPSPPTSTASKLPTSRATPPRPAPFADASPSVLQQLEASTRSASTPPPAVSPSAPPSAPPEAPHASATESLWSEDEEDPGPLNTLERQAVEAAVGPALVVDSLSDDQRHDFGIDAEPTCAESEWNVDAWELGCLEDTSLYFLEARHRELERSGKYVEPDGFVVCAECLRRLAKSGRLGLYGVNR